MSSLSYSNVSSSKFWLTGFPGFEWAHCWIAIPIFSVYLTAVLGNATIIHIVRTDSSLQQPMYYFLAMLAGTDLGLCVSTMPTVLGLLWLNFVSIHLYACVFQLYFVHTFSFMESAMLLAMAYDRFVAITNPLRYSSVLTTSRVVKIGVFLGIRSASFTIFPGVRLFGFSYCHDNILSHSYCLHQDMIRLSCSDTRINSLYALSVILLAMGSDFLFIFLSYILILRSVMAIASHREQLKALNTCVSHILAVLVFYVPVLGLSIVHRFARHSSPLIHIIMGNVYILFPPLMNPVIYSIKTHQIRQAIIKVLSFKWKDI
ncbi:olfactory receptor 51G1 [Tupaia chinensis]|uniref:Olfactory receptor n=1 Tax=Tupaia chinensis TaxID=246437 RepID=L9KLS1_TUPCH|nr:olfactory receptor 51G1 [Tupaia chinensis]ELW63693.1 Olfactory receptor 51G1 [Tupaia chinensis]